MVCRRLTPSEPKHTMHVDILIDCTIFLPGGISTQALPDTNVPAGHGPVHTEAPGSE